MGNTLENAAKLSETTSNYSKAAAGFMAAFGDLGKAAMTDSPLDARTNEMIFVAIGIARQCEVCLLAHTKLAVEAGVSRDELVAIVNLSVLMGGGPASAYGAIALEMYDDFASAAK